MRARRTVLIVGAAFAGLLLVALLGWRNYLLIRADAAEGIARRQQLLTETIAVALGSELVSRTSQLEQLNGLPSIQHVATRTLPGRLNDLFASTDGPITGIIRVNAQRQQFAWQPAGDRLGHDAVPPELPVDELLAWSARPDQQRGVQYRVLQSGDRQADILIVVPTYETASGPEFPRPSGRHAGFLAMRVDLHRLAARYVARALTQAPDSTLGLLLSAGVPTYWLSGAHANAETWEVSSSLWEELRASAVGRRQFTDPHGHHKLASWAVVNGVSVPIVVWLDQEASVADVAVAPYLLRLLPVFALLAMAILGLAWALERSCRSRHRYRALVDHAADGIVVLSSEGTVAEVNDAGARMAGLAPRAFVGRPFVSLLGAGQHDGWRRAMARARSGTPQRADWELWREDGTRVPVEISLTSVAANLNLGIMRDMRDQRALELQLQHAQKMEALGRVAGGIAHDFNNLLTAILGYNQLVMHRLPDVSDVRADALELERAAERAAQLTRRLLAFSRRQVLEPQVLDLNVLVQGMEALLRRVIGSQVRVQLELDTDLWLVEADPGQVEQILLNLAVNARDAMSEGGLLRIQTGNVRLSASEGARQGLREGDHVTLAVTDTGTGIPDSIRAHVFEPFYTTKPAGTGTGLGLSTVYGIVQQSGGAVVLEVPEGRGTTVRIWLPRTTRPLGHAPRPTGAVAPTGHATILLVEDDASVRAMLAAGLERLGYRVLQSASPLDARELFRKRAAEIDVLVTDVQMPQMTGVALAGELLRLRAGLRVLLISGHANDVLEREPLPEGAVLLQKPFTADAVAVQLATLLGTSVA